MAHVTLVYADDWEGLYIDGTCVMQNNTISVASVLHALVGREIVSFTMHTAEVNSGDYLPPDLKDVRPSMPPAENSSGDTI